MAKVLHVLIIEALGLHHYVAHLSNSISKYCKVAVLGYSRKYIRNIQFRSIIPKCLLQNDVRIRPPLLMFMSLFYTPLKLWHLLRKQKYDIVHIQGHVPWLFLLFPYMHKKRNALVWTVHDPVYRPSYTGIKGLLQSLYTSLSCLPSFLMKHSDFVIVHGKKLSKLLEDLGVESWKIKILPHGNLYLLSEARRRAGKTGIGGLGHYLRNYVLFFGKIKPYKGIETIIHAVPIIKKEIRNLLIVVAGSGKIERYLSLISADDRKNFEFLNYYVPDEDIPALLQNAAVVVLPYKGASQSGVLSLAYTFGKPVIVSRVGSIDEWVDNGTTGFIFEPNNHISLAKFVVEVLTDEKLRKKMELNCYKKAFSELSWEKIARDTYEIYKGAVAHL